MRERCKSDGYVGQRFARLVALRRGPNIGHKLMMKFMILATTNLRRALAGVGFDLRWEPAMKWPTKMKNWRSRYQTSRKLETSCGLCATTIVFESSTLFRPSSFAR
jgi:hypothetical protein